MKKNYQIHNHNDLSSELRQLKTELHSRELQLLTDTKQAVPNMFPKMFPKMFRGHLKPGPLIKTPQTLTRFLQGKLMTFILPQLTNKVIFKKSGWFTRQIAAFVARRAGKSLDSALNK